MRIFRNVVTFKGLVTSTFFLGLAECLTLYYPSYRSNQQPSQRYPAGHGTPPPPPSPQLTPPPICAKIWNQYGNEIKIGLNQELAGLEIYNFVPVSIEIWDRCVLFLVDSTGNMNLYYSSTVLREELCWPITYAHGESCMGKVPRPSSDPNAICAILFDAPLCSTMLGFATEGIAGDEEPWLGVQLWRKVSSIVVRDGCELEIYDADHFQGRGAIVTGTVDLLSPEWDDQIVSFKCKCSFTDTKLTTRPMVTSRTTTTVSPIWPIPLRTAATPYIRTTASPAIISPQPITTSKPNNPIQPVF